jgi:hypothetical protein
MPAEIESDVGAQEASDQNEETSLTMTVIKSVHEYEVRPRDDHRGVDLLSDALPFGRLWYDTPDDAIGYAMHSSRSRNAVIRVYDSAGNVIETQEQNGNSCENLRHQATRLNL